MSSVRQLCSVTAMGLRSVPARLGTSMVIVIGVAAVVTVFIAALAVAAGFTRVAEKTGSPNRAIVLSGSAATESASALSRENAVTISNAPGMASYNGAPVVSFEAIVFVALIDERTRRNAYATLRGVGPQAFALRPEMRIVDGEMFKAGTHEIIVGSSAQRRFSNLTIGSTVSLPNGDWTIVGVFESGGDSHESELITGAEALLDSYKRNAFNTVTVALEPGDGFVRFKDALYTNPTLSVQVLREDQYFARVSGDISRLLIVIAYGIGGIMALGAVFGALNTMYSAVSTRAAEIATLRAIGFDTWPLVASVLIEALALSLGGAVIGAALVWVFLDGFTISTLTGTTPSQITYALRVTVDLVLVGIAWACAIALIGGLFAAARITRMSPAMAMRAA